MHTLKKRQEFLDIAASGIKWVTPAFVLQMGCDFLCDEPKVGFTASRKVGNAVKRNRAKRRLRALAQDVLMEEGRTSHGYVLIARHNAVTRSYDEMKADLAWALKRIHKQWDEKNETDS